MKDEKDLSPEEQKRLEQFRERAAQEMRIDERMGKIKHKILIASGKGGVGKSSIAVNLAIALAQKGNAVGILDGDIHGPSVDSILGLTEVQITGSEEGIKPAVGVEGVKVMSMGLLLDDNSSAVIWRGPMKMSMIDTMLADTIWGELDYLIIDTPPGTGDEILSLSQRIKNIDGLIMVTTPQSGALVSAQKSLSFANAAKMPILGVIENMGPFECPHCGDTINLFTSGGVDKVAAQFTSPLLGSIPFDPTLESDAESGKTTVIEHPDSPSGKKIVEIAMVLADQLK